MSLGDHWQRQYEHMKAERDELRDLLNKAAVGLREAQAEAWDEGWAASREPFSKEFSGVHPTNPYREAS